MKCPVGCFDDDLSDPTQYTADVREGGAVEQLLNLYTLNHQQVSQVTISMVIYLSILHHLLSTHQLCLKGCRPLNL